MVLQVERIGVIWGGRISWILGSTVLKLPQILACFVGKSSRMAGFYQRPNPDFLRYISLRPTGEKMVEYSSTQIPQFSTHVLRIAPQDKDDGDVPL